MKHFHKTRPELREWILNVSRAGHAPVDVMRLMKEAGYDVHQSRRAISEVLNIPMSALIAAPAKGTKRPRHPTAPRMDVAGRQVHVTTCVEAPVVRVLQGLLSDEECAQLIETARPRLARSLTVDESGRHQTDERRSSNGMFFRIGETPLVKTIEERIAKMLDIPVNHGEGLQILHYLPGQEYEPHYDWFDPTQPGFAAVTERGGQRIASVVMYLNTPEEGGGTGFPNVNLTVTAITGSAVYFAYETGEEASLHAGLPVIKGEKWIATKWLRERPYQR
ncbi:MULTISPECIES: 2OG-Fe(II) oxygenase [Dyella]|uniref:2-oxoglutarate-dependent dioxygenase n=2 Tax=Dyella TaxID=231454 RepID=A0A4R0YDA9_9GAMM|nr:MULTISPECIES: 2OG-Fe(II) oxygenase [Dyella]TBR36339.1 2-oxoglutarate-dependent dioxygenase [Dyella terrae]TCI05996.1 2-oxoglutarate-dependent dioxygenase [Dyella soli]